MQFDDEDEDDIIKPGKRASGFAHRHRGEGGQPKPRTPMTDRGRRALRAIYDRTVASEAVRLADINRAVGEAPDHRGVWSILVALRRRGLITYSGSKVPSIKIRDAAAVEAELR